MRARTHSASKAPSLNTLIYLVFPITINELEHCLLLPVLLCGGWPMRDGKEGRREGRKEGGKEGEREVREREAME